MRDLVSAVLHQQAQEREQLLRRPVAEIKDLPANWSKPRRRRRAGVVGGAPCANCGTPRTWTRGGKECSACGRYRRNHGVPRPTGPDAGRLMEERRAQDRAGRRRQ